MANGWTHERKAKQRAAIYRWRPWDKSTGPKTEAGKRAVAGNAWKHGNRSAAAIEQLAVLRNLLNDLAAR
jgi:hypothetical protein